MKIKMTLLSDAVFGNGLSVPGGEDTSVLADQDGFPYYKATSFKGIFRVELGNLLSWTGKSAAQAEEILTAKLGRSGDHNLTEEGKLRFSDFVLSDRVKEQVSQQIGQDPDMTLRAFSYLRTFTAVGDKGLVKQGTLRSCRCLKQGLIFFGTIDCDKEDEELTTQVLSCIKWLGSMRTRGLGQVKLEVIGQKGERLCT